MSPTSPTPWASELVSRAAAGDEEAFGELAHAHADRAHAIALRMIGNPADAHYAVQDAMVAAWQHLEAFRLPFRGPALNVKGREPAVC